MNMNYLSDAVLVSLALAWPVASMAQAPATSQSKQADHSPSETFPDLAAVEALARAGKVQEEEQKIRQLREANPNRKEPLIYIGQRLMQSSPAKARPFFEQAAAIDPNDPYAQANLARIEAIAGQLGPARARLNAADQKRPDSFQLALARADIELLAKNPTGTLAAIKRAQSLAVPASQLPVVYSRLTDAHLLLSNWTDALDTLDRLLAIEPNLPRRFQRANVLVQLGRLDDASTEYKALESTALVRDPQYAKALQERIAYLKQAATQALTVTKANHSEYYALVTAAELADNFKATATYHCRPGAFVIAYQEVRPKTNAMGIEGLLTAPLRKVGTAGVIGEATLSENLTNPLGAPSLLTISGISAADQTLLAGRKSLKFCPAE